MTRKKNHTTAKTIDDARQKLAECPEFKARIWTWLENEINHKRRCSVSEALFMYRRTAFVSRKNGEDFAVNANFSAPIARLFIKEHPGSEKYIVCREAYCDQVEKDKRDQGITSTTTEDDEDE